MTPGRSRDMTKVYKYNTRGEHRSCSTWNSRAERTIIYSSSSKSFWIVYPVEKKKKKRKVRLGYEHQRTTSRLHVRFCTFSTYRTELCVVAIKLQTNAYGGRARQLTNITKQISDGVFFYIWIIKTLFSLVKIQIVALKFKRMYEFANMISIHYLLCTCTYSFKAKKVFV